MTGYPQLRAAWNTILLLLKPKYSWANHVLTLPTCRYREASTKLYPEHIRIPYPGQSSKRHTTLLHSEAHPTLQFPRSSRSSEHWYLGLPHWAHLKTWLFCHCPDLIKSILELVALQPFFPRITFPLFLPHELLSWGQAAHILGTFAFLLPPDSTGLAYMPESLLLQDTCNPIWERHSLVCPPVCLHMPIQQPVVHG